MAKYIFTPEIDNIIYRAYREIKPVAGNKPIIKTLAKKLNIPRHAITRRAQLLGVIEPKIKEKEWSEEEIKILTRYAHLTPKVIQKKLKQKGFIRTITAIIVKRKRLRLLRNVDGYSATSLASGFGVDAKTITRWIEKGYLKATRRGTDRTEAQGGDIWFIREKDVRNFIIEHIGLIDIRKVEKFWFVDILTNGTIPKRRIKHD